MRGLIVLLALGASAGWTSTDLGTPPHDSDGFVHAVGVNARGTVIAESTTSVPGGTHQQASCGGMESSPS